MVSTRTKYKFSDGEKVLCYEPDRTKAKVLYDSKVLKVKEGRDRNGRKTVEYLIHFQGWNPSWDRCVSEEYVLKDTEENRKLQRDLAERSKLHIGAYLYRKDYKRKKPATLSERVFEASNSCSSQDAGSADEYFTTTDDDKESSVETDDSLEQQKLPLDLSPTIQAYLIADDDLINTQHKLIKLPAAPTVVQILENYVRYFSTRLLRREDGPQRSRNRNSVKPESPQDKAEELEVICNRVNLCKEVVEGLLICFDYYLGSQLLYESEQAQYQKLRSGEVFYPSVKHEVLPGGESFRCDEPVQGGSMLSNSVSEAADTERRRSLRSHKDPAAEPCAISSATANGVKPSCPIAIPQSTQNHSSAHSTSSASSCYGPLPSHGIQTPGAGHLGAELAKLIDLTTSWRLVPESYLNQRPQPPSSVYGAIHLARLFDKLPSFLFAANLPENENHPRSLSEVKLMLLLHHLQSFLAYLESRQEWFGEEHYT